METRVAEVGVVRLLGPMVPLSVKMKALRLELTAVGFTAVSVSTKVTVPARPAARYAALS